MTRPPSLRETLPNLPLQDVRWLASIAEDLGVVEDVEALGAVCGRVIERFSSFERIGVYVLTDQTTLRLVYSHGFDEEERRAAERTAWDRHPGWVVREGRELDVPDTDASDVSRDSPRRHRAGSRFWLPIEHRGEVHGALGVASARTFAFDEFDREVLRFVTRLAAAACARLESERSRARAATAEAAARQVAQQARFVELLHAVPDGVVVVDRDGIIQYWNAGAVDALGHDAASIVGRPLTIIVPEPQRERHRSAFDAAVRRGESKLSGRTIELPALHADGTERLLQLRLSTIASADLAFVAVFRDVTEPRREEAARRAANDRERDLTREAFDISRLEPDDTSVFAALVADRVARLLDASVEVVGTAGGASSTDERCERSTLYASPIRSLDRIYGCLVVERLPALSVSEQRFVEDVCSTLAHAYARAERARVEARAQSYLDAIRDGLVAYDDAGRITFLNSHACSLTGWSENEAVGRHVHEVVFLAESETHSRLLARTGQLVEVSLQWSSLTYDAGRVGGLVSIRDMTTIERAEEAKGRLASMLDAAARLTRALLHDEHRADAVAAAFAQVGTTMQADRVYLRRGRDAAPSRSSWPASPDSRPAPRTPCFDHVVDDPHRYVEMAWSVDGGHDVELGAWLDDLAGRAEQTRVVSDALQLPAEQAKHLSRHGIESCVVVPLVDGDHPTSLLVVENPRAPGWEALLEALALLADGILGRQRWDLARRELRALTSSLEQEVEARTKDLDATQRRLARLFEEAPVALMMVDRSGVVLDANSRAAALIGLPSLRGVEVHSFVDPLLRAHHARWVTELGDEARRMTTTPVRATRPDGSSFDAEIHLVPMELDETPVVLAGILDVSTDVAARRQMTNALKEKETLLKEIHHRVKNNLQIIASLLNLQSMSSSPDSKHLWADSVARVRSMALVHEHLYGDHSLDDPAPTAVGVTDHSHVRLDLAFYLRRLAEMVRAGNPEPRRVATELESISVAIDVATPLGLIANELLTNAFKYGRPAEDDAWDVHVVLRRADELLRFEVGTRGPNLPAPLEQLAREGTLGVRLVLALAHQLGGRAFVESGCRVVVELPLPRDATTDPNLPNDLPTRTTPTPSSTTPPDHAPRPEPFE
ncbi:MAG: PAS domain S-box protein [Myxococcota bacterium]|nr:PAS domain S-box protein [Myxococcota bacterium]